jgi:tripartite-type tricarboxylate transporter receptor subunit TctC
MRGVAAVLMVVAAACSGAVVAADRYPVRSIRLLVGFPPGGPTDLTARLVAQHLAQPLGQQFVVDNRPGAGGTLAAQLLVNAAPDGHTLFVGANGEMAIAPHLNPNLPYDPQKDLAPVSRVGSSQLALLVHPSVAAQTTKELIALAKAKPGTVNFASSGTGSTAHLSGELFKSLAGIDVVHVPHKGSDGARLSILSGQVQMMFDAITTMAAQAQAGKVKALATSGRARSAILPDVPTVAEAGVPGYEATIWLGVVAPKGTPKAIVDRLNAEITKVTTSADVKAAWAKQGASPLVMNPAEFEQYLIADIAKWRKVITEAGIKQD